MSQTPRTRRRWFQFGLGEYLAWTMVIGLLLWRSARWPGGVRLHDPQTNIPVDLGIDVRLAPALVETADAMAIGEASVNRIGRTDRGAATGRL